MEEARKRGDKWVLTLRKEIRRKGVNSWWQEEFDAVIVASGHYNVPYIPDIPSLVRYETRFPGTILHSKHFRTAREYTGKVRQSPPLTLPSTNIGA